MGERAWTHPLEGGLVNFVPGAVHLHQLERLDFVGVIR